MGTISEKLTYLNETKGKIKDSINLTGTGITDQDTFRSYETKLKDGFVDIINNGVDTLYENFPKVAQTGEEPTLNGVYEAPMRVDLNGNTEQTTYTGKNFAIITPKDISQYGLTINYDTNTGKISIKGKANTTAGIGVANSSDLNIPSGEYTLSINKALPFLINYVVTDTQNTNRAFRIPAGSTNVTISVPYNGISTGLFVAVENNVDYDLEFYLQLETGSTPTSYEPYVGGTASPNPDYPQPIRVVKGDNTIKVTGKNLFDKVNVDWYRNNNSSFSNTTDTSATRIRTTSFAIQGGKTYTLSGIPTGISILSVRTYSTNSGDSIGNATLSGNTFTLNNDVNYIHLLFQGENFTSDTNTLMKNANIQLESGSTATDFQPYQEQTYQLDLDDIELCKIGDYKDEIKKSTGKNLFDKNNANTLVGYVTSSQISGSSQTKTLYIPCKPNTTYTISKKLSARFAVGTTTNVPVVNETIVDYSGNNTATSITITTSSNANYICVFYYHSGYDTTITEQQILDSIQIEEGSQATDYEPFGKVWYLRNRIGKVVLDGSENWFTQKSTSPYVFALNFDNYKRTQENICKCNLFSSVVNGGYGDLTDNQIRFRYNSGDTNKNLYICTTVASTTNDFKTWLSTHNTEVYYALATPTYTEITDTDLIAELEALKTAKSVEGQTNITQTNEELPFILDVSGLKKD